MKTDLPDAAILNSVLAFNGRTPGLSKTVLDGGWWFIDERAPTRSRVPSELPSVPVTPARCHAEFDTALFARLVGTARNDGWRVSEHADGAFIDLGGKRRAKAGLISVDDRGPSLYVEILRGSSDPCPGVLAYVLRLTSFLRRVRASWLDFPCGPILVWEAPLDMDDSSEEHLIEALCCLADAVQHGQAEAGVMASDQATAELWIDMNFPPTNQ